MNTAYALLARFESPTPRLEDVCKEFFGMDKDVAYQRANLNELPVPTFRLGGQKSPRLVHIDDLAKMLDEQRTAARIEWERSKAA